MEAHRKECPLEVIQCEYYSVGCKQIKLTRKNQDQHYKQKMEEHLKMTKNELTDTKAQLSDTKARLNAALEQINSLTALVKAQLYPSISGEDIRYLRLDAMATKVNFTCPVTFKMSEFSDKVENVLEWYSHPFYSHNNGYKMELRVDIYADDDTDTDDDDIDADDDHWSIFFCLMKGPHDDELTWPLRGKFEIKLLNQISDGKHHSHTIIYDDNTPGRCANRVAEEDDEASEWGDPQFISDKKLHLTSQACQYLKHDCLFFHVTYYN